MNLLVGLDHVLQLLLSLLPLLELRGDTEETDGGRADTFFFFTFQTSSQREGKKIEHPQIPLYDVSLKKRLHNRANSGHQNPQKPSPPPLPTNADTVLSPICLMLLNGLTDVF